MVPLRLRLLSLPLPPSLPPKLPVQRQVLASAFSTEVGRLRDAGAAAAARDNRSGGGGSGMVVDDPKGKAEVRLFLFCILGTVNTSYLLIMRWRELIRETLCCYILLLV